MKIRAPHLQDDALFDCYYAARRGETLDPPSAEHLTDCDACSRRFAELGTFLNTLSEGADADVNALFPAERLLGQQQDIARRLELVGRAARVITFPTRPDDLDQEQRAPLPVSELAALLPVLERIWQSDRDVAGLIEYLIHRFDPVNLEDEGGA